MANLEAGELVGRRLSINPLVANEAQEPLADVVEKRGQLVLLPFRDQLDAAIGQVPHEAIDLVPLGNRLGCVTKADALHVALIEDGLS